MNTETQKGWGFSCECSFRLNDYRAPGWRREQKQPYCPPIHDLTNIACHICAQVLSLGGFKAWASVYQFIEGNEWIKNWGMYLVLGTNQENHPMMDRGDKTIQISPGFGIDESVKIGEDKEHQ